MYQRNGGVDPRGLEHSGTSTHARYRVGVRISGHQLALLNDSRQLLVDPAGNDIKPACFVGSSRLPAREIGPLSKRTSFGRAKNLGGDGALYTERRQSGENASHGNTPHRYTSRRTARLNLRN